MSPIRHLWSLCIVVGLAAAPGPGLAASDTPDPHAIIQHMASAYDGVRDYTAVFLKRERINGTLLPLETIDLRFQAPFKVYMAWRKPYAGRVVVYVEGENDNKMLVNPGGLLRFLRLKLEPTSFLATQNTHHTIREAGLQKMIALLVREYERGRREGQMSLAFAGHDDVAGRPTYHLTLACQADKTAGYYAQRAEIWVDAEHFLPIRLSLYNWEGELYASYEYQSLRVNVRLDAEAFRLAPAPEAQPPQAPTHDSPSP